MIYHQQDFIRIGELSERLRNKPIANIYKGAVNEQIIKQNQMIGRLELRSIPFEELNWL